MLRIKQECEMELTSEKSPVSRKELRAKIRKQMEFYFGDENLNKDRYLKKLIDEDPWVDLKMFVAFRKIKSLTTDVRRIAKTLRKSRILDVSKEGTKVRLRPPLVEFKSPKNARKCIKAFRTKGCELSSLKSPNSLMRITALKDCDEQIAKKPIIKKDTKEEKLETENSLAHESDKKRKKLKHVTIESDLKKESVKKIKILPEEEIRKNRKKRKIRDSTAGANDTCKNSTNVNTELKKEKESDSESILKVSSDEVKVKKQRKKKREKKMEKEAEKEDLGDYSDLENRKEFRAEDFELSSYTSPNFPLRITIFEDSDEQIEKEKILKKVVKEKKVESENWVESDSKQDSRSQMLKNGKKKKTKKKFISIDLTESADEEVADSKKSKNKRDDNGTKRDPSDFGSSLSKMEKEHKSKKRKGRNSESFSESNGNYEIDNSPPAKSDKKRKKIKHEHSNLTEESVQEIKTLPEKEIHRNLKKRKISESTEGANDTSQKSGNVNSELKIEKESDSELIQEIYSDKFKVKKQKKKKRKRNLKEETGKENWPETIVNVETESGCSDPEHLKALRENGCRVSFFASPNSHLGITSFKDCDEHMAKEPVLKKIINEEKMESKTCEESNSKKDSISQIPENGKKNKKKKKLISIDLTESADEEFEDSKKSKNKREESGTEKDPSEYVPNLSKMEKEDKRKKRRERNSESLNASDEICEIDNSPPNESDKNRKKVKHEPSEATKQSVQGMKTLPENEICTNLKKRKISESTAGANDTSKKSGNVNTELKKEKESDSESIQEVPFDKVKVKEEKKKKREKNVKEETLKENFGDSETGIEIMGKRDLKQSRNEYLEMQISNVVNIDANKEESSKKRAVKEEKSAELSSTPGAIVNIETASPCSDPENAKSDCFVTGRGNVIKENTSDNLPAELGDLQDVSRQDLSDKLLNAYQANQHRSHFPHRLIGLMYQLDLSILCLLRKNTFRQKYPTLSLGFGDSNIDKFNNIVLRYKEKSIYIRIEYVENRYVEEDISYDRLFTRVHQSFYINNYFNSFVQFKMSELESSTNSIEYLIVYTNSGLSLTEEMRLKKMRSKNFYPFKFDGMVNCDVLKNFLFTTDDTGKQGFYQFSRDTTTREEFLKRLQFSPAVQKVMTKRQLTQRFEKKVKEDFFDKLVFAVHQPKRQELSKIIKNEIDKSNKCQYDYNSSGEEVLRALTAVENHKKVEKSVNFIPRIMYEFSLLMLFLHDMFLHKHMLSINFEGRSDGVSNDININYKGRITCIKAHTADSKIGFSHLFPLVKTKEKNKFSINKHFGLFIEDLEKDIRYLIIYTNADIDLTTDNKLKQGRSKDFYPLQFCSVDIQKKKYKIFRHCSCVNKKSLYQFVQEETREKLLSLLKLPPLLQKEKEEGRLTDENECGIKEKFLNKLIFAVNQPNTSGLNRIIRERIRNDNNSNKVSYNYGELHEIALRWSESHEVGPITQRIIKEIFKDIKNNRLSYEKIRNKNIDDEIKFAKSVVGSQTSFKFDPFLDFLIREERLTVLKRNKVKLIRMASILNKAGSSAEKAFKGLYDLWFDVKGNKTRYLKIPEEKGIRLATISGILHTAGVNSADAFKGLYDLWFDIEGNKSKYLKTVEDGRIKLITMSSILHGSGSNAAKCFKGLYDLWFDMEGNKTKYLKRLEEKELNLSNMSSILSGAKARAPKAFKDLYDLWFDVEGHETNYLRTLEENGVSLTNLSCILHGAGANASKAFKELYNSFFDTQGNTKQHLQHFIEEEDEKKCFTLHNLSVILGGSGANAKVAFEKLHSVCFNEEGKRTELLDDFYNAGFTSSDLSNILCSGGNNAASILRNFHKLCFDKENYLNHFLVDKEVFAIKKLCMILRRVGNNIGPIFKKLYDLIFDKGGNKTKYWTNLVEDSCRDTRHFLFGMHNSRY